MTGLVDGVQVVPRLWIGSNRTCDKVRQSFSFVCVNCGLRAHTQDARCNFIPLCGLDSFVDHSAAQRIGQLIVSSGWPQRDVLLHCGDALTYSPLAAALALATFNHWSFTQAYAWVKGLQPGMQDLSRLARPVSTNTAWAGA